MKNFIDEFLSLTIKREGSDLHLGSDEVPMGRIHGDLTILSNEKIQCEQLKNALYTIMGEKRKERFEREKEIDFSYHLPGVGRFRVNVYQERKGIGCVFRVIPEKIMNMEELGLPPILKEIAELEQGLVLVTGPTGSGKSTTLAAMIEYINQTKRTHIITVEDPIEFTFENKLSVISQREIFTHVDSFPQAIRSALREDPDILMIGELRDRESISLALQAAEMGILVVASLHTSGAVSTVNRIVQVFPPEEQGRVRLVLSQVLKWVISQQLVRKKDGKGRRVAVEVLIVTPGIANLIRTGKVEQIPSAMETGKARGMMLMDESLLALYRAGYISIEEAYEKAFDKTKFEPLLKEKEIISETLESGTRDEITGVYSYPYFLKRLNEEIGRGKRYGRKFSLLRLKLGGYFEYLKKVGEIKARHLLKKVGELLEKNIRKVDLVAHSPYEDEFVFLFPETGEEVKVPEERLSNMLENFLSTHYPQEKFAILTNIVHYPEEGQNAEVLLKKLYLD